MATNLYYHFDSEGYSELLYKVFSDRDISDEAINKLLVEVENTTNNVLSFEEEVSSDYEMVTCLSEECNAEINELLSNPFLDIYFVNGNIKNIPLLYVKTKPIVNIKVIVLYIDLISFLLFSKHSLKFKNIILAIYAAKTFAYPNVDINLSSPLEKLPNPTFFNTSPNTLLVIPSIPINIKITVLTINILLIIL